MRKYVETVAASRSPKWSFGLAYASFGLLLVAWLAYYSALEPLPEASEGYKTAARATRLAQMGWAVFFALMGLWQGAKVVRGCFGLPSVTRAGRRWPRYLSIGVFLFILTAGLRDPVATVYQRSDDRWIMGGVATLVWLVLAYDLIPLVRLAFSSLRARVSAMRYKRSTVGGLESGAVRIEGIVAPSPGTFADDLIYRHDPTGEKAFQMTGFLLESGGHRLSVDVVDGNTMFVSSNPRREVIGVGEEVEVWGQVERPDDAFRGQLPRMSAGDGRLYVFQGDRKLNRRLLLAAIVELLAATSLLVVGVFYLFFVFDLYLFTLS